AAWARLAPTEGPDGPALKRRFDEAVKQARARQDAALSETALGEQAETLVAGAEQLAAAADVPSRGRIASLQRQFQALGETSVDDGLRARFAAAFAALEARRKEADQKRAAAS